MTYLIIQLFPSSLDSTSYSVLCFTYGCTMRKNHFYWQPLPKLIMQGFNWAVMLFDRSCPLMQEELITPNELMRKCSFKSYIYLQQQVPQYRCYILFSNFVIFPLLISYYHSGCCLTASSVDKLTCTHHWLALVVVYRFTGTRSTVDILSTVTVGLILRSTILLKVIHLQTSVWISRLHYLYIKRAKFESKNNQNCSVPRAGGHFWTTCSCHI